MSKKFRGKTTMDEAKSTTDAKTAHEAYDEMNQLFDDIEKDPEGFKAGMRRVQGEVGAAFAQFIVEALAEFPDIMRATPQTASKKEEENRSQYLKRKSEFDEKFKAKLSVWFSEQSPEQRESQLASWRTLLSNFYDSDSIERVLQDLNVVDPEDPSNTKK